MKHLTLFLCCILLNGCMRAGTHPLEIEKASKLCESNGGLYSLYGSSMWRPTEVNCKNGARFILQSSQVVEP